MAATNRLAKLAALKRARDKANAEEFGEHETPRQADKDHLQEAAEDQATAAPQSPTESGQGRSRKGSRFPIMTSGV